MAEKIDFDLSVSKNDLSSALDSGIRKASTLEDRLSTAVSVFAGNLLTKAFDVFVGGLSDIVGITGKAIDAAAEQETVINNLNAALARSGNFTKENSKELQEYASHLQSVSTFGDEATVSSIALLQSLTNLDVNGLKRTTTAAADFATVLGIDLESATRLLAKAAIGQVDALKRYGIEVEKASTDSETFERVLTKLNSSFGGAANSQLNTYNGAVKSLGNAYGDLFEPIGDIVVKNTAVVATFNAVKDIINELSKDIADNNSEFRALVTDGIFVAIAASQVLFDSLDGVTRVAKALGAVVTAVGPAITLGLVEPFKIAFDAIASLLQQLPLIGSQFEGLINPLESFTSSLKDDVVSGINDFKSALAGDNIFTKLSEGTSAFGDKVIQLNEKIVLSSLDIKNANKERVTDEDDTNRQVIAQRLDLNNQLASMQLQMAADQKTFDEQLAIEKMDQSLVGNEIITQSIMDQKVREAEVVYQGELNKNLLIEDAEAQRIANVLSNSKKEEAIKKASRDKELIDLRASKTAQVALEQSYQATRNTLIGQGFQLAATLAKDGSKEQFLIQKAAALAEIIIGDGKARALIPAQVAAIPYPANLAAAATLHAYVTAQTAIGSAIVAASAIKGFADGGIVGGSSTGATNGPDNQVATIRTGELVLNANQQKSLFDAINSGNLGGGDIIVQIDGRTVATAVRNQIRSGFVLA